MREKGLDGVNNPRLHLHCVTSVYAHPMRSQTTLSGSSSKSTLAPMTHEHPSHQRPEHNEPDYPAALPPELAEFLKNYDYACITQATDQGTAFVMKVPGGEIDSVRGTVPIQLSQELYVHPTAPVIRLVFTIYDQPQTPLALETFINITDDQQRTDYAALATQEALALLFYDESLTHRLTKMVPLSTPEDSAYILQTAEQVLQAIPPDKRDFDAAKAVVMRATQL
jgi:hypothetical protein